MSGGATPTVSIGLPVYNGENYLVEAIHSVLLQTFRDLELIICDNASSDGTQAISEAYAARDARVRYVRNPENLGAAPNYNRTFELARGRYFKWLGHDDRIKPSYLARTVAALEARPELVLCNTRVEMIDAEGGRIGTYVSVLDEATDASPAERFALFVLRSHTACDFFGVIRRQALHDSLLHASFHGADRALLAQLALRGPMLQLPETLHQIREHDQRYTRRAVSSRLRAAWHDTGRSRSVLNVPSLELYRAYVEIVRKASLSAAERHACRLALRRWWWVNWNGLRVAVDIAALAAPGLVGVAERTKARLIGAAPGHFHLAGPQAAAPTTEAHERSDAHAAITPLNPAPIDTPPRS